MNRDEIRAMFTPGTRWRVQTTDGKTDELRTFIIHTDWGGLFLTGSVVSEASMPADHVREARPGYVLANFHGGPVSAIFTLVE